VGRASGTRPEWTGRRLARNQRVLVASPATWSVAARRRPEQLAAHDLPGRARERRPASATTHWTLQARRDGALVRVRVQGPLSSNSGELVRDWCLAGHGVMLRSLWDIAPQLASGELVRVLPQYAMPDADIHWVAPHTAQDARRVRLLVDFLAEQFRGEPWKPGKVRA
jgi:LysR family transcriptional activator of dmlA